FLAPRPVTTIWGVGKAFAATLEADCIRTISQLQQMEENDLMRRYGNIGQRLARLSRVIEERSLGRHTIGGIVEMHFAVIDAT
ncbi:hypothetical protein ACEQ6C_39835, partial [Rhizobium ruizarguesonis]